MNEKNNIAFIDGQNLRFGTLSEGWQFDCHKLRIHLKDKYHVQKAYYYMGFFKEEEEEKFLYANFAKANFILKFREHTGGVKSKKKGNADTDIVFDIMKMLIKEPASFQKIVLISGDGDFKRIVSFLIQEERLEKIIFPSRGRRSSLYNEITSRYYAHLSDARAKIEYHAGGKKNGRGN